MSDPTPVETPASPPKEGEEKPSTIFGSSATTGTEGSIFGGAASGSSSIFGKAAAFGSAPAPAAAATEGEADAGADNEDGNQNFKPLIDLPEVKVETMEENEDVMFKCRARLYVFVKEDIYGGEKRMNQWKEKGTGEIKLLRHKEFNKVRVLMRRDKTLKICANHLVAPTVRLEHNAGSDKSWVFSATDFADEELKTDLFALKFGNSEIANNYKAAIEEAKIINGEGEGEKEAEAEGAAETEKEAEKEGDDLAKDVENLAVKEE